MSTLKAQSEMPTEKLQVWQCCRSTFI